MKKKGFIIFVSIITALALLIGAAIGINYAVAAAKYDREILHYDGELICPTGDFIQPWMCEGWEVEDFKAHLDNLSDAGFDTVLWQYSVVSYGADANIYYPTDSLDDYYSGDKYKNNSTLTERLLEAAQNKGFKVFMGLASDDDWWKLPRDENYYLAKAEKDNLIARELYSLYKSKYPDAFYGWYWSWEMFVSPLMLEDLWSAMLNKTLSALTELDDTMPLLFSPFAQKNLRIMDGGAARRMWERFFTKTNFRKGDIFAPQDSIGKISAAGIDEKALASTLTFLQSCYLASKKNENVRFFVNCELFSSRGLSTPEGTFDTASFERIKDQLKIASRFAEGIITFSYSHYVAPNSPNGNMSQEEKQALHERYIAEIVGK